MFDTTGQQSKQVLKCSEKSIILRQFCEMAHSKLIYIILVKVFFEVLISDNSDNFIKP